MKKTSKLVTMIIISCVSLIVIYLSMSHQFIIDRNKFALNDQLNTTRSEFLDGRRISGSNNDQIHEVIKQLNLLDCGEESLIWLGNSQQHTINHYSQGQHLAVYWLAKKLHETHKTGCVNAISYPNISIIEINHIINNLEKSHNVKLKNIIIPLEFMGFRETGVREDILSLFGELSHYDQSKKPFNEINVQYNSVLLTPQWISSFDTFINKFLKDKIIFWSDRLDIQSTFIMYVITLRNKIFNIKSTSVRPLLESRMYEKFKCSRKNTKVL